MKKTTKIIILLIIIAAAVILIQSNKSKETDSAQIKIGAVLPLSGDFASFGEEINRGALIAVDEAKQNGLVISYLPQDDKSEATGSVNAANKLVNIDKVDAAGFNPLTQIWTD